MMLGSWRDKARLSSSFFIHRDADEALVRCWGKAQPFYSQFYSFYYSRRLILAKKRNLQFFYE